MFGRNYYKHPELLISSFKKMNKDYSSKKIKKSFLILTLEKIYIFLFGIPEIGFQIRSQYFKKAINKIKTKKIKNILDAGSGIGIYSFWLGKRFKKATIDGWEIDRTKILISKKIAKENDFKNVNFFYKDITKIKKDEKYDLIVNIDVLEHIGNYQSVLRNFYEILNKDGYLLLHAPQINQKRIFKSLKKWSHEDHLREGFLPTDFKKSLQKIGYKNIEIIETFGFFGKFTWELSHIFLAKSFILFGILYPLLYLFSSLDAYSKNKNGLGIFIITRKK